jgi:acetyl esterase/lipase
LVDKLVIELKRKSEKLSQNLLSRTVRGLTFYLSLGFVGRGDAVGASIDVGSAETFRDEDVAYATRIWQAGGQAELHVWPGGFHGFTGMVPDAALSKAATAAQRAWLRRILAR